MVKVIVDNQLYVYFEGKLLYKRWYNTARSYGKVFHENEGLTIKAK
jgi:hypothetical protein